MRVWSIKLALLALSLSIMCQQWAKPSVADGFDGLRGVGARKIYLERCAGCHGLTGAGDGPQAAVSNHHPHNFSDCSWMGLMSDASLFLIIEDGASAAGFESGMPAFGDKLSRDQIVDLIGYIRSFCPGNANGRRLHSSVKTVANPGVSNDPVKSTIFSGCFTASCRRLNGPGC